MTRSGDSRGITSIVEGLAQRIAALDVPESLKEKRLLGLDMGSVVINASLDKGLDLVYNRIRLASALLILKMTRG